MPRSVIALLLLFSAAAALAADFSAKDLDGRSHSLAGYHGKWVVLNFWATWCPYCAAEIPDLNAFYRAHKGKDATVLGLNVEDVDALSDDELVDFVHTNAIAYPVVRTTSAMVRAIGPVRGLPTTYLLNPDGKIVARQAGPMTSADLERFISTH